MTQYILRFVYIEQSERSMSKNEISLGLVLSRVLLLIPLVQRIHGSGKLTIDLIDFNNKHGRDFHGSHCDEVAWWASSACDHKFVFCVDSARSGSSVSSCRYKKSEFGPYHDRNQFAFNIHPVHIPITIWPGSVLLKVEVIDHDSHSNHDYVGLLSTLLTGPSSQWKSKTVYGSTPHYRNSLVLRIKYRLSCDYGYYGDSCSVYCKPTQDASGHYTCDSHGNRICLAGWTGSYCTDSIDDCSSSPCSNGATCTDGHNSYTCVCAQGFTGAQCEQNINDCKNVKCQNGGRCNDLIGKYKCICPDGFYGDLCETDHDYCAGVTCHNDGTCIDRQTDFICKCKRGYSGDLCETNNDDCADVACENGGSCKDLINGFECVCPVGITGKFCQTNINNCLPTSCLNGGRCLDGVNSISCECSSFWNGPVCEAPEMERSDNYIHISLKGRVRGRDLERVCTGLALLVSTHTSLTAGDLNTDCVSGLYLGNDREHITSIQFKILYKKKHLSNDLVKDLIAGLRLTSLFGFEIYTGPLHPLSGDRAEGRSSQQDKNNEKNWIGTHWYVILIVVFVCLIIITIVIVFVRRKRAVKADEVVDEKSESYINPLFVGLHLNNSTTDKTLA